MSCVSRSIFDGTIDDDDENGRELYTYQLIKPMEHVAKGTKLFEQEEKTD